MSIFIVDRSFLAKLAGSLVVAALLAFNGWWYWRDHRSVPSTATINDWMSRQRYQEAEAALVEHLRRSPHDADARITLARARAARGDMKGCALTLHEVPSWWPRKAEALLREGQAYLSINRAKDAERALLEVLHEDPLHTVSHDIYHDAAQDLLKIYAIEDRWEDAYPVMWMAYDHAHPMDYPALLAMRMRPELERVAPKESIIQIEKYVDADASDWEALRALARAELQLGQYDDAVLDFQACLKGRPDDVRAWRDYLAMLLDRGDFEAFVALLAQPPPSADTEPETWFFRGVAQEKAAAWQSSAEAFKKAIELNPYAPKYYYRLAMAEERLGQRQQAAAHRLKTKQMNDARAALPGAYADYFSAQDRSPGAPKLATACRRLGLICETLGWIRASQGWNKQAALADGG